MMLYSFGERDAWMQHCERRSSVVAAWRYARIGDVWCYVWRGEDLVAVIDIRPWLENETPVVHRQAIEHYVQDALLELKLAADVLFP